jgi:hypothetical protein
MTIKTSLLLLLTVILPLSAKTQLATEFWFVAPELTSSHGDSPVFFRFASMDEPTTVTISQPANPGFPTQIFNLAANTSQSLNLAAWLNIVENQPSNSILNRGFKITATSPISAYYESNPTCSCNPDIMSLKGSNALGTSFVVAGQTFYDNDPNYNPRADAKFDIVATENNTTVTIIPSNNLFGRNAGVPFTIVLNAGQTWSGVAISQFGPNKVVGTIITSDKPISVTYTDDSVAFNECRDVVSDQLIPTNVIGTEYIAVRGFLLNLDRVFVTAANANTEVFINGSATPAVTLALGQTYMIELNEESIYINTSQPAYVFHVTGFGCEVGGAILPPIVCTGSFEVPFIRSTDELFAVIIVVPNGAEDAFMLDGQSGTIASSLFNPVPGTNGDWLYARIDLTSAIQVNQGARVQNTKDRFHLAIINGGANTGCRYGFFSDFSSLGYQVAASGEIICEGGNLVLTSNPIPGATYDWTGPNGFSAQGVEISIDNVGFDDAGWYFVSGNEPSACQLLADSVFITVTEIPEIAATYDPLCDDKSISIEINVEWFADTQNTVQVDFGDGQNSLFSGTSINHTYDNAGQYSVTINAVSTSGCIGTIDLPIQVNNIPQVNLAYQSFCTNTVDFNYNVVPNQNNPGLLSHFWLIEADTIFLDAPSVVITGGAGVYDANFGLITDNGCIYNYSFSFVVDGALDITDFYLPNVITANEDGVNDEFLVDTDFDACVEYTIDFINRWGNVVFTMTSNADPFRGLDQNDKTLPVGVYFYKLSSELIQLHGYVHVIR